MASKKVLDEAFKVGRDEGRSGTGMRPPRGDKGRQDVRQSYIDGFNAGRKELMTALISEESAKRLEQKIPRAKYEDLRSRFTDLLMELKELGILLDVRLADPTCVTEEQAFNARMEANDIEEREKREVMEEHFSNADGCPEGGQTYGCGFAIAWQRGPLGRGDGRQLPNGAFIEDVIKAGIGRLEYYQASKFACQENADALEHLGKALDRLHDRTRAREERGVEGTWEK